MEIERTFLVTEPPNLDDAERIEIEQGYLTLAEEGGAEVRLRRAAGEFFLTVKGGEGGPGSRRMSSSTRSASRRSGR